MQLPFPLLLTLQGIWAIDETYALELFNSIVPHAEFAEAPEPLLNKPFAIARDSSIIKVQANSEYSGEGSVYDDAPKGSIAIVALRGVMTKHDQWCGPVGTSTIAKRILDADGHKNIDATILIGETGGGQMVAITPIHEAVLQSEKPVIYFAEDITASAGLMTSSKFDLVIANTEMCGIGSFGVMSIFQDNTERLKSNGIIEHRVYSDYSYNKNRDLEEALKGKYDLLKKKSLNPAAAHAILEFSKDRKGKLRDDAENFIALVDAGKIQDINPDNVFSADMFYAKDCLPKSGNGLIDEIGNLNYAVQRARELAKSKVKIKIN